jgi:hypothetical protein
MKVNSNQIIIKASTTAIALLLMAGIHNVALADNTTAVKTDGKVAEAAPADENFKALDANKDGKISLKEAVKDKALSGQFDTIDANHDGMISAEEYASAKTAAPTPTAETTPPPSKY